MGHYLSEMDPEWASTRPRVVAGEERRTLEKFYETHGEKPGTGSPCPRCGADVTWDWVNVKYILIHIKWHETVDWIITGEPE